MTAPLSVRNSQQRLFVISPYLPDDQGRVSPELPSSCPIHTIDGQSCRIVFDHCRNRKTGPPVPLHIIRCQTHGRGFTLYPPGYYPYSRHTLAPVALDGSLVAKGEGIQDFSGTLFDAALDASQKNAWLSESDNNSLTPRFTTQIRHLERASLLFGIEGGNTSQQEQTAQILSVSGQLLHDCANIIEHEPGYQSKGKSICEILEQLPIVTSLFVRLVTLGATAQLWAQPFFHNSSSKKLTNSPFQSLKTRAPPKKKGMNAVHNFTL